MEFLEGGELFEAITNIGSFTEASASKVLKQILSAVYYLHSNHIVHRDLKPENIMLTQKPKNGNYQIKLIDFGTAKIFKPGKKMNKFIGTSYYIAPEVLKERYDEKCDIWSCGVILFILLCGYPPFNGNTNVDIFHAIQNQNPIFGGEEWEDITPEAKDLIKLMLKKNPNERLNAEQCLSHKWFRLMESSEKNKNQKISKQIQINAINIANNTFSIFPKYSYYNKKIFKSPEEELAELEKELEIKDYCNKDKREKKFEFRRGGNEWNAISKYKQKLYHQQLIEERMKENEMKKRTKEDKIPKYVIFQSMCKSVEVLEKMRKYYKEEVGRPFKFEDSYQITKHQLEN